MKSSLIKNITYILLPFIQVFGIYIIVFGHLSPGGGFAGGSILGSSLILNRFVSGKEQSEQMFKSKHLLRLACSSLIMYGVLKGYVFISAFFGLHSLVGPGVPGTIISGGFILPLNILVGLVVAITFYFIAIIFEEGDIENAKFAE
ncbi:MULTISPECIES: MnhB domain-containing protein [unclassified Fusibacter]|uniref:MnhB domain-containing protein n=1 Tax=unclassified Fusibacter TaxID=2624464 RepID=UPI001012CEB1|nr:MULTISPECIES: MnhB domain-containing protein [unclassified Fusibacter]MCK8061081.1 MnhB domain-containing protein [Fusibacter sp. A2]NPE23383.1 MnhB domain-containing protein [Fusibacter sp. A1]RXV59428.1 hypothetical protein DWB64_16315 [Fusibacter sp. A1]